MKKFLPLFFMLFCITNKANAQDIILVHHKPDSLKFIQKIESGFIFGSFGKFAFDQMDEEKPFKMYEVRLFNTTLITPASYHELVYDFSTNGFGVINGWFFGKVLARDGSYRGKLWDLYLFFSKEFNSHDKHISLGVERKLSLGEVKAFPFLEVGTDFEGHRSALIGVLVSYQFDLYQRDH